MKISIGILAHNESRSLPAALRSLADQTLLTEPRDDVRAIEVVCVPNGCTDDTARVAGEALEHLALGCPANLTTRVQELPVAGKPNAWNEFVHRISDPGSDYLILMDADIELRAREALALLVTMLEEAPDAHACVGMPLKQVPRAAFSPMARLSLSISGITLSGPPELNGGLYCARGTILRRIWLPSEIWVEDAYIKAMLVTDLFTAPEQWTRILRAHGATYEFRPYLKLRELLRHQTRGIAGSALNSMLYSRLWDLGSSEDAGAYAKRQSDDDPSWLRELLARRIRERGWWLLPPRFCARFLLKRFRKLRHLPRAEAVRKVPVALVGLIVEAPMLVAANAELRRTALRAAAGPPGSSGRAPVTAGRGRAAPRAGRIDGD